MNTSKPKYNIVTVKTVGEKDYYTRIGVAFPLEKGGFNILFDALPTNGRVLLLPERRARSDRGGLKPRGTGRRKDSAAGRWPRLP